MGKSILRTVVDLLVAGGVPAAPAQPERIMRIIHTPVAAVSIEKVDTAEGSVTVLVEIVAPMQSGGERCQERALSVCNILKEAGAECVQGGCTFHSRPALFRVPVTARFYGTAEEEAWVPRPMYEVVLAGAVLRQATGFSAQQVTDEEHSTLASAPWGFTVEEFYPAGVQEPTDPQEPFTLQVIGSERTQTFSGCKLTERERIHSADGIRQIRKGIAASRTVQ